MLRAAEPPARNRDELRGLEKTDKVSCLKRQGPVMLLGRGSDQLSCLNSTV